MRSLTLRHAGHSARKGVLVFDYLGRGAWYVRLIEWIEGPHYAGFVEHAMQHHIAPYGLAIESLGATSDTGGWWWCVQDRTLPAECR